MADEGYDAARESLVMETKTVWGADCDGLAPEERSQIAKLLHENPQQAAQVSYIRTHTGFCRKITVTRADLERLDVKQS